MEQQKIVQTRTKISEVREGFEGGLYELNDAKAKVSGYQEAISKAEQEIERLTGITGEHHPGFNVDEIRKELEVLAKQNLDKATFTENRDMINKLGIRVYPSEDLKTMKMKCSLDFRNGGSSQPSGGCAIIQFGSLRSQ